jgi:hypothetical protein
LINDVISSLERSTSFRNHFLQSLAFKICELLLNG